MKVWQITDHYVIGSQRLSGAKPASLAEMRIDNKPGSDQSNYPGKKI